MKALNKLILGSCAMGLAVAASAGNSSRTAEDYHISNGGTGFIGVTQSAGQPRAMDTRVWAASAQSISRVPTGAGEASTMVRGRPNQDPDAPAADSMVMRGAQTRAMGNAAARNPAWGTPD